MSEADPAPGNPRHLDIERQPNDTTCGPTCLHAVYGYFRDELPLSQIIDEVPPLDTGGTLSVHLGLHALRRGYRARIYTYNLKLFDPTWFDAPDAGSLVERLTAQARAKPEPKLKTATDAYVDFLERGGEVLFEPLTPQLLQGILSRDLPILTGLSATYLYRCAREREDEYDAIRGEPTGHFVVLAGYDAARDEIHVRDPLADTPRYPGHDYVVDVHRIMSAILLGIVTYDANLLVIERAEPSAGGGH